MTTPQAENLTGLPAVDAEGEKIGKVGQVYLNDDTGAPEWVTISTGLFGTKESFAPLHNSAVTDGQLVLAVSRQLVKDAPSIEDDGHLGEAEIGALFQHYAGYLDAAAEQASGEYPGRHTADDGTDLRETDLDQTGIEGGGASGAATDDAMTRSEEQLRVGTEKIEAGRARLRKHVVTENVTTTVPVSREELRVEREPVTEANRGAAMAGPDITEEEHEITLHAERPVVEKEAVPVERVRLTTETVTEDQQISEEVRKEQIEEPGAQDDRADLGR